jgi:hypothetical protein
MMQKGVESLESLDVSYVSSLSWYFMVMFGLRGFNSLVLGDDNGKDIKAESRSFGIHKAGILIQTTPTYDT